MSQYLVVSPEFKAIKQMTDFTLNCPQSPCQPAVGCIACQAGDFPVQCVGFATPTAHNTKP